MIYKGILSVIELLECYFKGIGVMVSSCEEVNLNNRKKMMNNIFINNLESENYLSINTGIKLSNLDNMVNTHIKLFKNQNVKQISGGFQSYQMTSIFKDVVFTYNAARDMVSINKDCLYRNIVDFLNSLEGNKSYSVLFVANSWSKNRIVGTLSEHSILVHREFSPEVLSDLIESDIYKYINKYLSNKYESIVDFKISAQYRVWLTDKQFGKDKFMEIKKEICKSGLRDLRKLTDVNGIVSDDVNIVKGFKNMKFYDFNLPFNYWFEKELFFKNICSQMSQFDLGSGDIIDLYKKFLVSLKNNSEYIIDRKGVVSNYQLKIVFSNVNVSDINYMSNDWSKYNNTNCNNRFIRQAELYVLNDSLNKSLLKWVDFICLDEDICKDYSDSRLIYYNSFRIVERLIDKISFTWDSVFKPTYISKFDRVYNIDELFKVIRPMESISIFNNFVQKFKLDCMEEIAHDQCFDNKIGVIDLETYPIDKCNDELTLDNYNEPNNSGTHGVYAGGWRVDDEKHFYYLGEEGCESQEALIQTMIVDIFKCGYSKYTFYAHNFARFDGHFITNSLLVNLPNCERFTQDDIKLIVGDSNDLIELKIRRSKKVKGISKSQSKKNYGTIKILDSLNIIPNSLDKIATDILKVDGKDYFPHYFMCKDTLHYQGTVPNIKYFGSQINSDEYKKLLTDCKNVWNAKDNCLKYLDKDLEILYDALIGFAQSFWFDYGINITKRKTISGLSLLNFQVNYLKKCGYKIPIIKGPLEKYFRSAYFGGITQVYAHKCDEGYHYDMNSQYPTAMTGYLPVGNEVKLMSVKSIDSCFGIIFADIISPSIEELRVPILPRRVDNSTVDLPHNCQWSGWYSTVDLQNAIENKYKVFPKVGIHFEKGTPLSKYVEEIFPRKAEAVERGDSVNATIYKLLLNTLYGRLGMRSEFYKAKIVNNKDIGDHTLFNHWKVLHGYSNTEYSLIKTGPYIDGKLIEIIKNTTDIPEIKIDQRKRGSLSSLPLAVHITATARYGMSKYKNIPNNPMIYSDTDSVILPKILDSKYIGKELGQMKLENKISKGIFIAKKLYAYKNTNNEVKIASAGINNSYLTWDNFEELIGGKDIVKNVEKFIVKPGCVAIDNKIKFTIKGISKGSPIQMHIKNPSLWLKSNKLYSLTPIIPS